MKFTLKSNKIESRGISFRIKSLLLVPLFLFSFKAHSETADKIMHLSFDDAYYCLVNLKKNANTSESIFENPFLAKLKSLHDEYGAVFSLYCFTYSPGFAWNIGPLPEKFAKEFIANSDWLKLGFHSQNSKNEPEDWQLQYYLDFLSVIPEGMDGRLECFDLVPRLHTFGVNTTLEFCNSLKNASVGVTGFLTADDARNSYYLTKAQTQYINQNDSLYDAENDLYFFRSETRLESVKDIDVFLAQFLTPDYELRSKIMPIFTHEHAVCNHNSSLRTDNNVFEKLETCIKWGIENDYKFDFLMNIISKEDDLTSIDSPEIKSDFITVEGSTISSGKTGALAVYDTSGKLVFQEKNVSTVDTNLSGGLYLIQFTGQDGRNVSKKIVIR